MIIPQNSINVKYIIIIGVYLCHTTLFAKIHSQGKPCYTETMHKINHWFFIFFVACVLSATVYSHRITSEKATLHRQLISQQQHIAHLESQLQILDNTGAVQGASTNKQPETQTLLVTSPQTTSARIVCAQESSSNTEICSDYISNQTATQKQFELEVPTGNYYVFIYDPERSIKTYFSPEANCQTTDDCAEVIFSDPAVELHKTIHIDTKYP